MVRTPDAYVLQSEIFKSRCQQSFVFPFSDLNAIVLGFETRMTLAEENIEGI